MPGGGLGLPQQAHEGTSENIRGGCNGPTPPPHFSCRTGRDASTAQSPCSISLMGNGHKTEATRKGVMGLSQVGLRSPGTSQRGSKKGQQEEEVQDGDEEPRESAWSQKRERGRQRLGKRC